MADYLCKWCNNTRPLHAFSEAGLKRHLCVVCERIKRYQLTYDEFIQLIAEQKGCCTICGQETPNLLFEIDHDHSRKPDGGVTVRGLLCPTCNKGLGMFKDDPGLLRKAAGYIETARKTGGISPESRVRKTWFEISEALQYTSADELLRRAGFPKAGERGG